MNNKTMMILSILTVGALLAVGIGYAAYSGIVTNPNNSVSAQYLTIAADDGRTNTSMILPTTNIVYNDSWTNDGSTSTYTYYIADRDATTPTNMANAGVTKDGSGNPTEIKAQIFGYTKIKVTSTESGSETFTFSAKLNNGSLPSTIKFLAFMTDDAPTGDYAVGKTLDSKTVESTSAIMTTLNDSTFTPLTVATGLSNYQMDKTSTEGSAFVVFAAYVDNSADGKETVAGEYASIVAAHTALETEGVTFTLMATTNTPNDPSTHVAS